MAQFSIKQQTKTNRRFFEDLGDGIRLEMVLIRGGSFEMGSPEDELGHSDSESPQHTITVPTFFMGRYPVTQAQWRQVAGFEPVNKDLETDPSRFKGDNLPVERVSWHNAVEFCNRLEQRTKRLYRLPSEAEWEYACRAGTQTPFHFGETITDKLANYNAPKTYGRGTKGEYRGETTPVGTFSPNAFGLHDMHGNVWEWCLDNWHGNYEGAPTDGRAWIDAKDSKIYVLRSGSWDMSPRSCRSAQRNSSSDASIRYFEKIGFRVVCVPGTP